MGGRSAKSKPQAGLPEPGMVDPTAGPSTPRVRLLLHMYISFRLKRPGRRVGSLPKAAPENTDMPSFALCAMTAHHNGDAATVAS